MIRIRSPVCNMLYNNRQMEDALMKVATGTNINGKKALFAGTYRV